MESSVYYIIIVSVLIIAILYCKCSDNNVQPENISRVEHFAALTAAQAAAAKLAAAKAVAASKVTTTTAKTTVTPVAPITPILSATDLQKIVQAQLDALQAVLTSTQNTISSLEKTQEEAKTFDTVQYESVQEQIKVLQSSQSAAIKQTTDQLTALSVSFKQTNDQLALLNTNYAEDHKSVADQLASHSIFADDIQAKKNLNLFGGVLANNAGSFIEHKYSGNVGDRYGIGEIPVGSTKMYASSVYGAATNTLSFAKADGTFSDVIIVGHDPTGKIFTTNINGATNIHGNATIDGTTTLGVTNLNGQTNLNTSIQMVKGDPGPMIEKQYNTDPANRSDRYGFGQYPYGNTRMYSSTAYTGASNNLSFAKKDGSFDDVLKVYQTPGKKQAYETDIAGHLQISGQFCNSAGKCLASALFTDAKLV